MPRVLILSSFVAASRVGGFSQTHDFDDRDVWSALAPTVLFGRQPGLGPPGGGVVSDEVFAGVIEGIEAAQPFSGFDAVLTGYFATVGQVMAAAAALDRLKQASPSAIVLVDPIMGDLNSGLYVGEAVAQAVIKHLVPRATLLTPNAWEAEHITGHNAQSVAGALKAAMALGKPSLISSVAREDRLGALYWTGSEAWYAHAPLKGEEIKGAGDLLAADFLTGLLWERSPKEAVMQAVSTVAETKAKVEKIALQ